jgi:hypothetical protein
MASFMPSRRSFVGALTAFAGAPFALQPPPARTAAADWDMTWLDRFKGTHKQVFDLGSFDLSIDTPLRVPTNYLDTFREVYRLTPPEVNVAIGVSRVAFPINASDALWQAFALGERWGIKDPETGKPATRNIFLGAAGGGEPTTVRGLQARGAFFWQCNVALGAVVFQLARATNRPQPEVRTQIVAGLNPGVTLVASHAMAVAVVQERGFTYMKV